MNITILVIDIPIYFKINILTTTGETVRNLMMIGFVIICTDSSSG